MQVFTGQSDEWNDLISRLPNPHFLQTWEWGQIKSKYGWEPMQFVWDQYAAISLLKRTVSFRGLFQMSILYAPKGPLLDWSDELLRERVLDDLQSFAREQKAIFLKIDPDVVLGRGVSQSETDFIDNDGQAVMSDLTRRGWMYSSDQIQFKNTLLVDLSASEDVLLARMKQKTRYNVRLAEKKKVVLRVGTLNELSSLYKMYAETSVRDGFVIRDEGYYQTVWNAFMSSSDPACEPLIAEVDGEPVAAIFIFYFAGRAYYVYGMSRDAHREKMPAYLLQWEAIKRAKQRDCTVYDLWGAPDVFDESDSMWGVYRFKEGLGGQVVRTLGAFDFAPNKLSYKLYTEIVPRILDFMRKRGKAKTKQSLGGA